MTNYINYLNNRQQIHINQLHRPMQQQQNKILYEDQTVLITQNDITLKKSFFSLPINKTLSFHQIQDVFLMNKSPHSSSINDYLNPFSPKSPYIHNQNQNTKSFFIELWLKNSPDKPTFSPLDPQLVFNIIQTQLHHEQFRDNINLGVDHLKKAVESGYGEILTKLGKFVQDTSTTISKKGHQISQQLTGKGKENIYKY